MNKQNDFLLVFKRIIREANYTNTYKMAWARALVELSGEIKLSEEVIRIRLLDIAKKVFKYYFNQTIFFDLIQGSNLTTEPVIIQIIKDFIKKYYGVIESQKPDVFERINPHLSKHGLLSEYENAIEKIKNQGLKTDVSWRFLYLDGKFRDNIYVYEINDDFLWMDKENLKCLYSNQRDLFDLINYRWGLILESFNSSPRINKKVKIIDDRKIRRASLSKFRKYLDHVNPQHICFICGEKISDSNLSIDHIIPWSYLYSDDIWNLTYVHRSCNSSKSNVVPRKIIIEKLQNRNKKLLNILEQKQIKTKLKSELEFAIDNDYVYKFWIASR